MWHRQVVELVIPCITHVCQNKHQVSKWRVFTIWNNVVQLFLQVEQLQVAKIADYIADCQTWHTMDSVVFLMTIQGKQKKRITWKQDVHSKENIRLPKIKKQWKNIYTRAQQALLNRVYLSSLTSSARWSWLPCVVAGIRMGPLRSLLPVPVAYNVNCWVSFTSSSLLRNAHCLKAPLQIA